MRLRRLKSEERRLELLLWAVSFLSVSCLMAVSVGVMRASVKASQFPIGGSSALIRSATNSYGLSSDDKDRTTSAAHVLARLDIPKLGLSAPVLSDFDEGSLLRGIGHIQGTALPGGLGTMGLAGHRDTYFRPLRNIARSMEIRITDPTGIYHYEVDTTEIVTPDHVKVLDIGDRPRMTLITCYPFDFIGAAPKRFIVHAHLLSVSPDSSH